MKTRSKIASVCIAMVLLLAVMMLAVYAAQKVSIRGNDGTITYQSKDVHATVSVTQDEEELTVLDQNKFDENTAPGAENLDANVKLKDLTFSPATKQTVIAFAVKNDFEETTQINVTFTNTLTDESGNVVAEITATNGEAPVDSAEAALQTGVVVEAGETLTITVTLKLVDGFNFQTDINAQYSFAAELTRVSA